MTWKKLFLIGSEILGLVDNTLTGNYKYCRSNRENLRLQIEIKLSEKPQTFCCFFFTFLQSILNYKCSEKNMSVTGQIFLKLLTLKNVLI